LEDAKKYLQTHGVSVTDVRNANFETLGIDGTPTLLLVDREGKVVKSWRGKLDTVTETEVLDRL
jgi:thioredoxin-related protein